MIRTIPNFFCIIFLLPLSLFAQFINNNGLVHVSGSAEVSVVNDQLVNQGADAQFHNFGKVLVQGGNFRNVSNAYFWNNDTLWLSGSFTDSAAYTNMPGMGTLILQNNIPKTFISRGVFKRFNHLVLAGGGNKLLNGTALIDGNLAFFNGNLIVGNNDTLGIDSLGTTPLTGLGSATNTSFVVGKMYRRAAGADVYFPVGKVGNFRPINLKSVPIVSPLPLIAMEYRSFGFGSVGSNVQMGSAGNRFESHWRMFSNAQYLGSPVEVSYQNADYSGGAITTSDLTVAQTDSIGSVVQWQGIGQSNFVSGTLNKVTSAYALTQNFVSIGFCKNLQLNIKAWLEGPYVTLSSQMTPTNSDTLLKYYGINGTRMKMYAGTNIPTGAVDVITLFLRSSGSYTYSDTTYAWLLQDGSIRDYFTGTNNFVTFCTASPGNYHVMVSHRNHLAIMSSGTSNYVSGLTQTVDMTAIANVFGGGAALLNGVNAGMFAGNARNQDQEINSWDLYNVTKSQNLLQLGYQPTDVNLDLVTNATDYNITSTANDQLLFSTVP